MKRWQKLLPIAMLGLGLLGGSLFLPSAQGQEDDSNKKSVYLYSIDFPPNMTAQYPSPPIQETKFWQLMDKNMGTNPNLSLTSNVEQADYQVELRCGGIINCTKLVVNVKDPKRTVLTTFTLSKYRPYWGLGQPDLKIVSEQLTQKLDEHLKQLDQGGYGNYTN